MSDQCYWQARSEQDCIIVAVNLAITLGLGFTLIRLYTRASKYFRERILHIYIGIGIWGLINIAKNIYSLTVFYCIDRSTDLLFKYTTFFMVLDILGSIAIQTLFLYIPYNMWRNVVAILARLRITKTAEEIRFIKIFNMYMISRFVLLLLPTFAIPIVSQDAAIFLNYAILGLQLVDALMCSFVLLYSIRRFKERFDDIHLNSQAQRSQLVCQYRMMVIWNVFRFFMDLFFLFVMPILARDDLVCLESITEHLSYTMSYIRYSILYLFLATMLTHFVPVGIIIYIYRPKHHYRQVEPQQ